MVQLQLRPRGVGEIIGATFTIYRKRFGPMIAIALVLGLIPAVLSILGGCTAAEVGTTCDTAIGWVGEVAFQIATIAASAAAALVAAGAFTDVTPDWRKSAGEGLRRVVSVVVATIVVGVLVAAGFVLVVVPGIILGISFMVVTPAIMIERIGPFASMGRSWRLVSGERWRLFGVGIVTVFTFVVVFGIAGIVLFILLSAIGIDGDAASNYTQKIISMLAVPMAGIGTVIYLDLRVRKEDLQAEELAAILSRED